MKNRIVLGFVALLLVLGGLIVVTAPNADGTEQCVPKDAWTETIEHPEVSHEEPRTVVVKEAWTEVIPATDGRWENLTWAVWTGGPVDSAPAFNDPNWNDVPAIPNGAPHQTEPGVYNVSRNDNGNSSWFRLSGTWVDGTPEQTINHPAETREETVKVVDEEAWTEVIEHPAVTCEDPEVPETPDKPRVDKPKPPVVDSPESKDEPVAVPTAVDAGI